MRKVIIALDFSTKQETFHFINQFNTSLFVKVGMELFYKEGNKIIKELKEKGHLVFLDLKLHDIPTTVYKTMKNIAKLEVDMVNVHALGGKEMMKQAVYGLNEGPNKRPLCMGVTVLTSHQHSSIKNELLIEKSMDDAIMHYAMLSKEAGLDGVVCSPLESSLIHKRLGNDFLTVTPGIRLEDDLKNDQERIATPEIAKKLGSNYIVVGRSITQSKTPKSTYEQIKNQFIGK